MLFAIAQQGSFLTTWIALTVLSLVLIIVMSGSLFYRFYWHPIFERWRWKSNPAFPRPTLVRREVIATLKGLIAASFCPSLALHLVDAGWSQAYGGLGGYSVAYLGFSFLVAWIGSDFFEFAYHRLGHQFRFWWSHHKAHHAFYNPSPFAVIADGPLDQFVRSSPLLVIPILMPINMDLLFFTYGAFFYGYGVYLHLGYEFPALDAHHPWINTSFQHYIHHAKATGTQPIHTGFFLKLWDKVGQSEYSEAPDTCLCAKCCIDRGERSVEAFETLNKPDYSVLLSPSFWWTGSWPPEERHRAVAS